MKTKLFLAVILLVISSLQLNAQCKTNDKNPDHKYAISADCNVDVEAATKSEQFIFKWNAAGNYTFIKSTHDYYFFLLYNPPITPANITNTDTLTFLLSNMEKINLGPCGNFEGKQFNIFMPGLGFTDVYYVCCYYKIEKEQLTKISQLEIKQFTIKSHSNKEPKTFEDEIFKKKTIKSIMEDATCILSL